MGDRSECVSYEILLFKQIRKSRDISGDEENGQEKYY